VQNLTSHTHRPSPAVVIAIIALVVAAAGGGYAAAKLPKNSVGTAQLRNRSVTSAKVKNHSLLAVDFKPGQLERILPTAIGPMGPTGARGRRGAQGLAGHSGSDGAPGPVGDSGGQGPIGTQGPAGLSYGNSIVGAPTSSLTGCGTADLANMVINPTQTSRVWISGQARLSATGATGARLIADVRTGSGSTLGSPDSGAPFPVTATLPVQYTFGAVVFMGATPVDLPPGTYNVRLQVEQTVGGGSCSPTVTASSAGMTVLFVGTTP